MPEGTFNQQEKRLFEDMNKNLKDINSSVQDLTKTIKQQSSRTNQNTLMFRLVEAVQKVGDHIKEVTGTKK